MNNNIRPQIEDQFQDSLVAQCDREQAASPDGADAADVAFLAMSYFHLGREEDARRELARLREVAKSPRSLAQKYAEYYVDDAEFIVRMPVGLKHLHVLAEPMSCAAKAVQQAFEAQKRLQVWDPKVAFVTGAGQIGLLTTLILRLRGLEVTAFGRTPRPYKNADLVEAIGGQYVDTTERSIADAARDTGPFDLILEGTGSSAVVFDSMLALGKNGVLVLTSITGGGRTLGRRCCDRGRLPLRSWYIGGAEGTIRKGHHAEVARGADDVMAAGAGADVAAEVAHGIVALGGVDALVAILRIVRVVVEQAVIPSLFIDLEYGFRNLQRVDAQLG